MQICTHNNYVGQSYCLSSKVCFLKVFLYEIRYYADTVVKTGEYKVAIVYYSTFIL